MCLLIVFAAYQNESPLPCDEDVTSNLPGTLYLKKTFEEVVKEGGGCRINGGRVITF